MIRITVPLLSAFLLLAPPAPGAGQVPTLERVDSLITAGDYDTARATLEQWWSARDEFDVPGSDKARALMLRARLAPGPDDAEPDYLAVVLGYPTSEHAPAALLRLGQGLLATGDAARAAAYIERLIADYPGRNDRTAAFLWLARAHTAARNPAAACRAARVGLQDVRDSDLAAMLRVEAAASCATATAEQDTESARPSAPAPAAQPGRPAGDWAVQTGAFRYRDGAHALMDRLREAGHSPRLVRVPRNDLLRVRVGRFASSDEAGRLLTRLRDQGFDAVVVNDAAQEREP
ncbi:MAG: SPOR domain-containing protein [Gemmatimonadota bacterium]